MHQSKGGTEYRRRSVTEITIQFTFPLEGAVIDHVLITPETPIDEASIDHLYRNLPTEEETCLEDKPLP
jgi:hypothetical protein